MNLISIYHKCTGCPKRIFCSTTVGLPAKMSLFEYSITGSLLWLIQSNFFLIVPFWLFSSHYSKSPQHQHQGQLLPGKPLTLTLCFFATKSNLLHRLQTESSGLDFANKNIMLLLFVKTNKESIQCFALLCEHHNVPGFTQMLLMVIILLPFQPSWGEGVSHPDWTASFLLR